MDSFGRRLLDRFRIRLSLARQWIHAFVSPVDIPRACLVETTSRSKMNVSFTFRGGDEALEKKFSVEDQWVKFFTLAGHRSVDGCRASLYNGLPLEGVVAVFRQSRSDFCRGAEADSHGIAVQQTMVIPQLQFLNEVIDVPVVQVVRLPGWWSQLQFSDTLVTCPLLSTTGAWGLTVP